MTKPVHIIGEGASIDEAIKLMLKYQVSGLPVVNASEQIVGIVTEGDFLRRIELGTAKDHGWRKVLMGAGQLAKEYVRSHGRKVGEIMTPNPITVDPTASLSEIVALMEKHRVKRLPVVSDGHVQGIVSRSNLLRVMSHLQAGFVIGNRSDEDLRNTVLDALAKQPWSGPVVDVVVTGGVVHLYGRAMSEAIRQAASVVAENIPGVKNVMNHMIIALPEMQAGL